MWKLYIKRDGFRIYIMGTKSVTELMEWLKANAICEGNHYYLGGDALVCY